MKCDMGEGQDLSDPSLRIFGLGLQWNDENGTAWGVKCWGKTRGEAVVNAVYNFYLWLKDEAGEARHE